MSKKLSWFLSTDKPETKEAMNSFETLAARPKKGLQLAQGS